MCSLVTDCWQRTSNTAKCNTDSKVYSTKIFTAFIYTFKKPTETQSEPVVCQCATAMQWYASWIVMNEPVSPLHPSPLKGWIGPPPPPCVQLFPLPFPPWSFSLCLSSQFPLLFSFDPFLSPSSKTLLFSYDLFIRPPSTLFRHLTTDVERTSSMKIQCSDVCGDGLEMSRIGLKYTKQSWSDSKRSL